MGTIEVDGISTRRGRVENFQKIGNMTSRGYIQEGFTLREEG